ncbi:MAG TPA: FKBP-type peptidyl-prolyl cis-trans isomerase [Verrucomicrobiae bacterium]|nr:FKBP-type peptidyl-prolyl cis-trans isomerase [Verrucomicrobiae bacterium]
MKNLLIALMVGGSVAALVAADDSALKDEKDKISYGYGMEIGKNLKRQGIEINADLLAQGLKATLNGDKTLLTDDEVRQTMMAFQQKMQAARAEKSKKEGEENKTKGEAFLAENKKKEGVQTTASGLQYKVITKGTGPMPKADDTVKTHYRGTLIDGTEFDSSYKRGEPATFGVTQVIKGWTEALLMMPVGSKWQLFIPGDLAYGPGGRPGIPPNATLLFDIELLAIEPKAAAAK